jgi:hypothetical protein
VSVHIYRVTVRGFFKDLDPDIRAALLAVAEEHDHLDAAFTEAGTFTYESRLTAFSFRFELREQADDDSPAEVAARAEARALDVAEAYLAENRIGHGALRVQTTDMADMWRDD